MYYRYLDIFIGIIIFCISPILEEFMFYNYDDLPALGLILSGIYKLSLWFPNLRFQNILLTCLIFSLFHLPTVLLTTPRFNKRTYVLLTIQRLIAIGLYRWDISNQSTVWSAILYHCMGNILCFVVYWCVISKSYVTNVSKLGIIVVSYRS